MTNVLFDDPMHVCSQPDTAGSDGGGGDDGGDVVSGGIIGGIARGPQSVQSVPSSQ